MRILFAGLKYDYGIPERGYSFEYYNLYDSLVGMGHETELFDFYTHYRQVGSEQMTAMLRRRVEEWSPDLVFFFLYGNEFDPRGVKAIRTETNTVTFNWFADDHWRFDNFSRHWADCFSFVSTTDAESVAKYRASGYDRVLLTQWAANPRWYRKGTGELREDVTFVGQAHGNRPMIIRALQKQGIPVKVMGTGWNVTRWHHYARRLRLLSGQRYEAIVNSTRISQQDMIAMFQTSRINLNLSGSSQVSENQIKGRSFEIPACGGFQLSGPANRLDEYLVPDREVVVYESVGDLAEKIRWYLDNERERGVIAAAGYERVLRDHTYERRFKELFRAMGLV